ncbi:G-protein coupled receptor moody-like [Pararge aegeria]|uniref:G-protein coupled receptor moody-like n=1 Tax=Pararge aegeria TaxID=116150 RepID=UPI0019D074E1|nr:G-protein coupled receptor moody-like [Pararge aegeria]
MESLLNKSDIYSNDTQRILVSDADYAAVELFKGYPDGLLKFAYACCVISMIIGIPGNIVTIVALARYKRVRNATAIFIMNLSCADLLFCCITPALSGSTFWNRAWTHGRVLCRLYPPTRYILIAVSIFTILAITINRYIIIAFPRIYRKIYQKRNLKIMLAAIWIAPLLALLPTILGKWGRFDLDPINGSCSIVPDENKRSPKQFLFIASFGLPCIPIILCYARIYFIVRKATKQSQNSDTNKNSPCSSNQDTTTGDSSSITVKVTTLDSDYSEEDGKDIPLRDIGNEKSEKVEIPHEETDCTTDEDTLELSGPPKLRRNVLKRSMAMLKISLPSRKDKRLGTMIFAIMTSFCLCHLPIVLIKVLRFITPHPVINIAAHILLYFSSCINPVIYVVMSSEYKKAYKNLFNCRRKGQRLINNDKKPYRVQMILKGRNAFAKASPAT